MVIAAIDVGKARLQAASLDQVSGVSGEARFAADREALHGWVDCSGDGLIQVTPVLDKRDQIRHLLLRQVLLESLGHQRFT